MNTKDLFSPWVIGGELVVALILLGGFFFILRGMPVPSGSSEQGAALTVIPAPTTTPSPTVQVVESPTATPSPGQLVEKGAYVQISGTGGDGLRLRVQPSLNGEINYLGLEDETFLIIDGPRVGDGFTWWHLESPTDPTRNGWGVSDYLQVIEELEMAPE